MARVLQKHDQIDTPNGMITQQTPSSTRELPKAEQHKPRIPRAFALDLCIPPFIRVIRTRSEKPESQMGCGICPLRSHGLGKDEEPLRLLLRCQDSHSLF